MLNSSMSCFKLLISVPFTRTAMNMFEKIFKTQVFIVRTEGIPVTVVVICMSLLRPSFSTALTWSHYLYHYWLMLHPDQEIWGDHIRY